MGVIKYKTDGSRREFNRHFERKRKDEIIRELWESYGHIENLQKQKVDLEELIKEIKQEDESLLEENGLTLLEYLQKRGVIRNCEGYFDKLVNEAKQLAQKASVTFPQPNYVALKIAEEAGEVVRGCVHYAENRMEWKEVEGEIIQLIAMLYRLVYEGDMINGVHPPKDNIEGVRE